MTIEEDLQFDLPVWDSVSTQCKQLLVKMLTKNPTKRITLQEACDNSWFDTVCNEFGDHQASSSPAKTPKKYN